MSPFLARTLIFILLQAASLAWASRTDSLLSLVMTMPEDSGKVLTLNELFKEHLYTDPRKAHGYAMSAFQLAQKIKWDHGTAKMANNLGVYHSKQGNFGEALRYHDQVMRIRQRQGDPVEIAHVHMNIGSVLYKQSNFVASLQRYQQAIALYHPNKDTAGVLAALNNIATVRREMGAYTEAQEAYLQVMRVQELLGNAREAARTANNLGGVLHEQRIHDAARTWYWRGLRMADSIGDNFQRAAGYNALAELAIDLDSLSLARSYLDSSILIAVRTGDAYSEAFGYMLLSDIQFKAKNLINAEDGLRKALTITREIGRRQGEALALYRLGSVQLERQQFTLAAQSLEDALAIAREIRSPRLTRDVLHKLSRAHAGLGDHKAAYLRHVEFYTIEDSMYNADRAGKISEMHERYEAGQKQRIIDRQNLEHARDQLRILRVRQGSYLLVAIIALVLIVLGFFSYRFRQRIRLNKQIALKNKEISAQRDYVELQNLRMLQINANLESLVEARTAAVLAAKHELDTFLYESAHALRRPITRIDGLMNLILSEKDPIAADALRSRLDTTLRNMDQLLHQLSNVHEVSTRKPAPEQLHLAAFVEQLRPDTVPPTHQFRNDIPAQLALTADPYLLRVVLSALLDNAAAFHPNTPGHQAMVHVEAHGTPSTCHILISDNGTGIHPSVKDKVFAMFVRGTVQGQGNGLGLFVARSAADKMGGTLQFRDRPGGGTIFELVLPATV